MMMKKKKKSSSTKMEKLCFSLILFFVLQMALVLILKGGYYPPGSGTATYIHRHYHHFQVVDHRKWKLTTDSSLSVIQDKLTTPGGVVHDHEQYSIQKPPETVTTTTSKTTQPIHYPVQTQHLAEPITCDRSNPMYDWCHFKLPVILHPTTATLSLISSSPSNSPTITEKLKPYPRKSDTSTMSKVTEITLTTTTSNKKCQIYHESPALIFSVGGYTGNFFHDFNDGFIPLYVTLNTHFPNTSTNIHFVVTDSTPWWHDKYKLILKHLTHHPIITLNNHTTHCFPSTITGLITHGPMSVKPHHFPHPTHKKTLITFRNLLNSAFHNCSSYPIPKLKSRPRLVIVTREPNTGRTLLNEDEIIRSAQEEGFDVTVFNPNPATDLCRTYKLLNTTQVMVGVHGAALTHSLFLPTNAVFIQIVPLGIEWLAQTYFGNLAFGIKLDYDEYNIKVEESTLSDKYEPNSRILIYPVAVASRNWTALNEIYLRGQDVRLDVGRFKEYLKRAFFKAKNLMEEQGLTVRRRRGRMTKFVQPLVFT